MTVVAQGIAIAEWLVFECLARDVHPKIMHGIASLRTRC